MMQEEEEADVEINIDEEEDVDEQDDIEVQLLDEEIKNMEMMQDIEIDLD